MFGIQFDLYQSESTDLLINAKITGSFLWPIWQFYMNTDWVLLTDTMVCLILFLIDIMAALTGTQF